MRTFEDFDTYSRALIASKDVDPTYIVIPEIIDHYKFEPEWFALVYVSFYNLGAAIQVCKEMPSHEDYNRFKFIDLHHEYAKYGIERRGNVRIPDVHAEMMGDLKFFMEFKLFQLHKEEVDNLTFRHWVEQLEQHGTWASFKIAEVFEKALGWKHLALPDLGLEGRDPNSNDGPVGGLRWLFGREHKFDRDWFKHWNRFGWELAREWGVDIGEVETALCKWHKMCSGKYYIGHDIHEFEELIHVMGEKEWKSTIGTCFDKSILFGDEQKPLSVQRKWKGLYKESGKIQNAHYATNINAADVKQIILDL